MILLDGALADPRHEVRHTTSELLAAAVERWLRRFDDQPFSLTDAVSFEIMRSEGIAEAFTLDKHFAVAGYTMIPSIGPANRPRKRNRLR